MREFTLCFIVLCSLHLSALGNNCQSYPGLDYDSDSQKQLTAYSSDQCCALISSNKANAAVFDSKHNACWLKWGNLKAKPCVAAGCTAFCAPGGSCPGSIPPTPSGYKLNFDTSDDYLGIAAGVDPSKTDSYYYFVIGDWGGEGIGCDTPQDRVAQKMRQYRKSRPNAKLLFIIGVGDSFYWNGLGSDMKGLKNQWKNVYSGQGLDDLTNVPWFNIMGNHDWGNSDYTAPCPHLHPRFVCDASKRASGNPGCGGSNPFTTDQSTTAYSGNQLDGSKQGALESARDQFKTYVMPDFSYFYQIKKLDLEIIGLETNEVFDFNGLGGNGFGPDGGANKLPGQCGGLGNLQSWMKDVATASQNMFNDRIKNSPNGNTAIFQHYPGNTFRNQWVNSRGGDRSTVLSFFGHTHNQNCVKQENGQCVEVLTGGGGGCCPSKCNDGTPNGFTVVSFKMGSDGKPKQYVDCHSQDRRCSVGTSNFLESLYDFENLYDLIK